MYIPSLGVALITLIAPRQYGNIDCYVHKIKIVCFVIASSTVVYVENTVPIFIIQTRYYLINHDYWNILLDVQCSLLY